MRARVLGIGAVKGFGFRVWGSGITIEAGKNSSSLPLWCLYKYTTKIPPKPYSNYYGP